MMTGAAAGLLMASAGSASAFTFTTQTSTNLAPTGDIILSGIELAGGRIISDFAYVNSVSNFTNEAYSGGNTGAASTEEGDTATSPISLNANEDPTAEEVAAYLGNSNLNNLIDTEDDGAFSMDLDFGTVVRTLFLWERGANSKLQLQALDAEGNLIGDAKVLDSAGSDWGDTGFDINTTEIAKSQSVVSRGVKISHLFGTDADVYGVRVVSEANFNGPDWKIIGTAEAVPEPATILGLTALAGAFAVSRTRKSKADA